MARFRRKRFDTLIKTIESKYKIDLNVRSDMKLGNLLERRGFSSLSALVAAYKGRRHIVKSDRSIFLSFYHPHGNRKGWVSRIAKELGYAVVRSDRIQTDNKAYIEKELRKRISSCSVLVCLIGYGAHSRSWIRWEIEEALKQGKGVCGIRLPNPRDAMGRTPRSAKLPPLLELLKFPVIDYPKPRERASVIRAIEQAAAAGSTFQQREVYRALRKE